MNEFLSNPKKNTLEIINITQYVLTRKKNIIKKERLPLIKLKVIKGLLMEQLQKKKKELEELEQQVEQEAKAKATDVIQLGNKLFLADCEAVVKHFTDNVTKFEMQSFNPSSLYPNPVLCEFTFKNNSKLSIRYEAWKCWFTVTTSKGKQWDLDPTAQDLWNELGLTSSFDENSPMGNIIQTYAQMYVLKYVETMNENTPEYGIHPDSLCDLFKSLQNNSYSK